MIQYKRVTQPELNKEQMTAQKKSKSLTSNQFNKINRKWTELLRKKGGTAKELQLLQ